MDIRTFRITTLAKQYDRRLYAVRINGMIQIWREGEREEILPFEVDGADYVLRPHPQFILALTDNWQLSGNPVEWGLEPVSLKLRSMDAWRDDTYFDQMLERREMEEKDKKRMNTNELRAVAADCRKDFAKATNEVVVRK